MDSRRSFLQVAAAAVASLGGVSQLFGIDTPPPGGTRSTRPKPGESSAPVLPRPVITPDVKDLPFTLDNDMKVFRLVADPDMAITPDGMYLNVLTTSGNIEVFRIDGSTAGLTSVQVLTGLPAARKSVPALVFTT